MKKYEVYETNAGNLILIAYNEEGHADYIHTGKERTAPQSGVPGVTWCRNKWQLTYKGKYIGVYDTVEAAESKKRQLERSEINAD